MDSRSDDEDEAEAVETSTASSCNESQLVAGNDGYSVAYETLQTLGKGAFGYVRLARRRADQQLVSDWFCCLPAMCRQPTFKRCLKNSNSLFTNVGATVH